MIIAIGILACIAILFAWCALGVASACDRMEAARHDPELEGVEIEGGVLYDVEEGR